VQVDGSAKLEQVGSGVPLDDGQQYATLLTVKTLVRPLQAAPLHGDWDTTGAAQRGDSSRATATTNDRAIRIV
jgi:hypothetical protein